MSKEVLATAKEKMTKAEESLRRELVKFVLVVRTQVY